MGMPEDFNLLLGDGGDSGGGDAPLNEPAQPAELHEIISQYGVPEDIVAKVREGSMLKSDYTRKTQELAEARRAQEAQQQQINTLMQWALSQQQQTGQQPTESAYERKWKELTKGEDNPQLAPLRELYEAQKQDLTSAIAPEIQGLKQQLAMYQAKEQYDGIYKTTVVPNFGNELDEVWPKAVAVSQQFLMRGQVVDPLTVIAQYEPATLQAAALKYGQGKQKNAGLPSEGMVTSRTGQPVVGNGTAPSGDPTSTANILREVEAMMRRGASA